ncbi:hypothetical protein ACWFRB_02910 [Rhodococcus sp. NPDC055112]
MTEQVRAVAEDHGLQADEVIADLEKHHRFAILDPRPNRVYVVGDADRAGSWVDRAPEATWEALWAVYRIRHPHVGFDWNQSYEGHLWVLAHRLMDPPAVVEVVAPLDAIRDLRGSTAAHSLLQDFGSGSSLEEALDAIRRRHAEWYIDPDAVTFTNFTVVPHRVDVPLMRFISGEDETTFKDQLADGHWGEHAGVHADGLYWYLNRDLWNRLEPRRRAELEEMIGLPLAPSD